MHTSQLTQGTYTQTNIVGPGETGDNQSVPDSGSFFQDIEISRATLASGELRRRLDPIAFPQKGITFSGTDSQGNAFPPPAKAVSDGVGNYN